MGRVTSRPGFLSLFLFPKWCRDAAQWFNADFNRTNQISGFSAGLVPIGIKWPTDRPNSLKNTKLWLPVSTSGFVFSLYSGEKRAQTGFFWGKGNVMGRGKEGAFPVSLTLIIIGCDAPPIKWAKPKQHREEIRQRKNEPAPPRLRAAETTLGCPTTRHLSINPTNHTTPSINTNPSKRSHTAARLARPRTASRTQN